MIKAVITVCAKDNRQNDPHINRDQCSVTWPDLRYSRIPGHNKKTAENNKNIEVMINPFPQSNLEIVEDQKDSASVRLGPKVAI